MGNPDHLLFINGIKECLGHRQAAKLIDGVVNPALFF